MNHPPKMKADKELDEVDIILRRLVGALGRDTIEAKTALLAWRDRYLVAARIAELRRTIAYFDDEGRESKKVLRAFENNRIDQLNGSKDN